MPVGINGLVNRLCHRGACVSGAVRIALDLGTTAVKGGVYDPGSGRFDSVITCSTPTAVEYRGICETDAEQYLAVAESVLSQCMENSAGEAFLAIASQRSSFLIWDRDSGRPLIPLVSWRDTRGLQACRDLASEASRISALTGLPFSPYYLGPKVWLILKQNPQWKAGLESGRLCLGTLDAFLIWKWSSGREYRTDLSMAARTLLVATGRLQWNDELCHLFGVPQAGLPQIGPSEGLSTELDNGCIVRAMVADQSAALVAEADDPGTLVVNLGTGGFASRFDVAARLQSGSAYLRGPALLDRNRNCPSFVEATVNSMAPELARYPVDRIHLSDLGDPATGFCIAEPNGLGAPFFRPDIPQTFSRDRNSLNEMEAAAVLIEGFAFRLAWITDDFMRMGTMERMVLSGGLSGIRALTGAIAVLVNVPVVQGSNKNASLAGAARLGFHCGEAHSRTDYPLLDAAEHPRLKRKYHAWKIWLKNILSDSEPFSRNRD